MQRQDDADGEDRPRVPVARQRRNAEERRERVEDEEKEPAKMREELGEEVPVHAQVRGEVRHQKRERVGGVRPLF